MKNYRPYGFTLIELMIVIAIIAIIAAIAIPNLIEARKSGNEASAIGGLKAFVSAQSVYRQKFEVYADSLDILSPTYIDSVLGSGEKQGYFFTLGSDDPLVEWHAKASPVVPGSSGDRYFYVDQRGEVQVTDAECSEMVPLNSHENECRQNPDSNEGVTDSKESKHTKKYLCTRKPALINKSKIIRGLTRKFEKFVPEEYRSETYLSYLLDSIMSRYDHILERLDTNKNGIISHKELRMTQIFKLAKELSAEIDEPTDVLPNTSETEVKSMTRKFKRKLLRKSDFRKKRTRRIRTSKMKTEERNAISKDILKSIYGINTNYDLPTE